LDQSTHQQVKDVSSFFVIFQKSRGTKPSTTLEPSTNSKAKEAAKHVEKTNIRNTVQ